MKYFILFFYFSALVFGQQTVIYDQKNDLAFDIYYPKDFVKNKTYNVFAWVHGGGFSGGTRKDPDEIKRMIDAQNRGFVAISISYRLLANTDKGFGCDLPKHKKEHIFKQSALDVLNALSYLENNQKQLGFTINKLIIGGSSAGAETVLNANYLRDLWFNEVYNDLKIDGIVSYAGAIVDDRYVTSKFLVPTVFVHGLSDDVVPAYKAPHRSCKDFEPGFIPLTGSFNLEQISKNKGISTFSIYSKSGKHEWSGLKIEYLNDIYNFINQSIINNVKSNQTVVVD